MLHHKNPESNNSGFFAWAVQDENSKSERVIRFCRWFLLFYLAL